MTKTDLSKSDWNTIGSVSVTRMRNPRRDSPLLTALTWALGVFGFGWVLVYLWKF